MNSSFYNGISGVKSSQFGIDVWADNISNVNTIGYRSLTPEFSTVFSTTLMSNFREPITSNSGLGSMAQTTAMNTQPGSFMPTDNTFDLAIGGNGWFSVTSNGNQYFTRAGSFGVDANGYLVDGNGNYLLGTSSSNIASATLPDSVMSQFGSYSINGNSITPLTDAYTALGMQSIILGPPDSQSPIKLPDILYYPAVASTKIEYKANLDPSTQYKTENILTDDFDIEQFEVDNGVLNFKANLTAIAHEKGMRAGDTVTFELVDENGETLNINATLDELFNITIENLDVSELDEATITLAKQGEATIETANEEHFRSQIVAPDGNKDLVDLIFTKNPSTTDDSSSSWSVTAQVLRYFEAYDPEKIYDPELYYVSNNTVYEIIDKQIGGVEFNDGGSLKSVNMPTLSNSGTPLELNFGSIDGFDGLIASETISKTRSVTADGVNSGILEDYAVTSDGTIKATFTNGKSVDIAKIALYHFQNDQGLNKVGNTLYEQSGNSGEAFFYVDANGNYYNGTSISSNYLENSNTNLTTALTELIIIQKSFDASAKSITTSDEMIQNAINMKK